jgi:hypothetical protein
MTSNGKMIDKPRIEIPMPALIVPTPGRLLWLMYLQLAVLSIATAVVLFESFVVVPGYKEIVNTINAQREADAKHLKLIEDAHKRQVRDEATLILHQQQNLKLAKDLQARLKGD